MKFSFDNQGRLTESSEGNIGVVMQDTQTGIVQQINPNADIQVIGTGRQWFVLPSALGGGKAYVTSRSTSPCPFCSKPSDTYNLEGNIVLVICFSHENPYMWGSQNG